MEDIVKTFGPVTALGGVSFAARPGTVHALCGENGAGKSTLMKVLSGVYTPDSGRIIIGDQHCIFTQPKHALAAGISMLYQELDLAEDLRVYQNVFLGRELMSKALPLKMDHKAMIKATQDICDQYGFEVSPESMISDLTPGDCQIVELIKALMRNAKIIVMDEPTSSLSEGESARLFKIVRELRSRGLSIIYISHRMEEVMDLADDVSILRDGKVVHTDLASNLDINTVVTHMVGRELHDFYPTREPKLGEVYFSVKDLASAEGVKDISFDVRAGEIVGMAGLVGAGRTEVARAIFGITKLTGGSVMIKGNTVAIKNPSDAIRMGIAYLTEDRKRTGLCTNLPCSWNVTLPNYETISMKHFLNLRREISLSEEYGKKVQVKWAHATDPVTSLSGGNQQKVLIARWLMANSDFMIFDEPTRGIDVGAKREVYCIMNELAGEGKAVLMISSELPELIGICDRILVMRRHRLVGNLVTKDTTPEEIMHLAAIEGDDK